MHEMAFSIHNKVPAWSGIIRLPSYYGKIFSVSYYSDTWKAFCPKAKISDVHK